MIPQLRAFALLCFFSALPLLGCNAIVDTKGRESCSAHSECTARFGEPSACVQSACVKLLTPECTEVLPNNALSQDNVILIGYLGELVGGEKYGKPPMQGVELALSEIETSNNGFPGTVDLPARRHLAMLVCDHGSDPSAVARHLVDDVKVPLIIGASFSSTTLTVFDGVAEPAGVMMLSPSATSPYITLHSPSRLLWRTAPSDYVQAELLKYLVIDVEEGLHRSGLLDESASAKVAMPTKGDAAGQGLAEAAQKPVSNEEGRAPRVKNVTQITYNDPDKDKNIDWQSPIRRIISGQFDIILAMGTGEFISEMLPGIEQGWDTSVHARPWYVLPEGDKTIALLDWAADHPEIKPALTERLIGTAPGARSSDLYSGFQSRFEPFFDYEAPGNLAEFGYDAAYLALYAIAISNAAAPTGRQLADAMPLTACKVNDKKNVVYVGPGDFGDSFSMAATSRCIDFEGASGSLDFDPVTNEALSDIATWCLRPDSSGYVFDPPLDTYYSVEESAVALKAGGSTLDFTDSGWCGPPPP